jgi:acyl carrier protein
MVPTYFIFLDRIPLTSSGKVDRKELPHPRQAMAAREAYTAPRDQVEKKLVELWGEILDIGEEKIGLNSNFFDMGGHSLNAAILLSRIHKELDAVVPLAVFFQCPTIRELSVYIKKVVKEEYAPVKIVEKQEYYDLSHAQKRLWIADQFEGASNAYNIPRAYILTGDLEAAGFERAFEVLVERHECLRTTFFIIGGEPKQKINDMASTGFKLKYIDLKNEENPGKKQHDWATREAAAVFDLEKGPLLRATLLHLEQDKYTFLFTIHHIIADGWSMNVIINEISTLYEALIRGENPRNLLLPLKIQYKDYTAWQNNRLKGNSLEKHREYWLNRFKNNIPRLEFPMDYARPALRTYNGNHIDFVLEKEIVDRMRKMGQANDASLFMLLLSLVHVLLYKYTGQEDIITGSPAAGREHSNLENQVGIYVNILALRMRFKEDDTFKKLLDRAKEVSLAAFEHQAYPFDLLVKELKIKHDPARNSLFDVMVALQNTAVPLNNPHAAVKRINRNNIRLSMFKTEFKISSFEICFNFIEKGDELILELIYNSDIFEEISIAVMGQKFLELTGKVCDNSDIRLKDIKLDDFITQTKIDKWEINI